MKSLLALLLLLIPLTSTAAAYQWVDENGNVRFGSKPQAEEAAAAQKTKPEPAAKKPEPATRVKTAPHKPQPVIAPAPLRVEQPAAPALPAQPARKTASTENVKPPSVAPTPPAVHKLPALPSTPAPKAKTWPASTASQKASTPPPKAAQKEPAPEKEKAAKKPVKVEKKASTPPASKPPAKKKPATKKAAAKKAPAAEPAPPSAKADSDEMNKNAELCGMFTTYVSNYENKLIGCQGPSCAIFGRALEKYQKKKQSYCR